MQQVMLMQLQRQTHLLRVLVLRQWLRLRHLLTSMTLQCRHCWHNSEQNQLTNSWGLSTFIPRRRCDGSPTGQLAIVGAGSIPAAPRKT
jgi:hypothetical protein